MFCVFLSAYFVFCCLFIFFVFLQLFRVLLFSYFGVLDFWCVFVCFIVHYVFVVWCCFFVCFCWLVLGFRQCFCCWCFLLVFLLCVLSLGFLGIIFVSFSFLYSLWVLRAFSCVLQCVLFFMCPLNERVHTSQCSTKEPLSETTQKTKRFGGAPTQKPSGTKPRKLYTTS